MRKLFARYSSDPPTHGRLLLSLVRFFLHHGQSEMYDSETPIRAYFGQVLTAKFNELVPQSISIHISVSPRIKKKGGLSTLKLLCLGTYVASLYYYPVLREHS